MTGLKAGEWGSTRGHPGEVANDESGTINTVKILGGYSTREERSNMSVRFMKTNFNLLQTRIFCVVVLGIGSFFGLAAATENSADTPPATTAIP
jgi:hypothetical protein